MSYDLPAVLSEDVISPEAAAKQLAVSGRTVARWITDGVTAGGVTIRLDGAFVGGRWRTSRQAVARFLAAVEAARRPPPAPEPSPAKQRKQARDDRRALERMGVKL